MKNSIPPQATLLLSILCCFYVSPAQDFSFSNGYETPLYLNAGYAGASEQNALAFQLQKSATSPSWPGFNHVASYHHFVPKLSGGLGIIWSSQYLEDLWTFTQIRGAYALHLLVNDHIAFSPFISLGLGINHLSENYSSSGGTTQGPLNETYFSIGTGFLMEYKQLTTGISVDHFNKPEIGWDNIPEKLQPKFIFHGTWKKQADDMTILQPGMIGQWQGNFYRISPSFCINYQGVIAGFSYLYQNFDDLKNSGIGGMLGIEMSSIRLVYHFTGRVSGDPSKDIPAHEFSLSYRFERH